jgi:hypothetical protein
MAMDAEQDAGREVVANGTSASLATPAALTVKQIAVMFAMTPKAVCHHAQRGQLFGKFYVGKSLRFRRADLLRLGLRGFKWVNFRTVSHRDGGESTAEGRQRRS